SRWSRSSSTNRCRATDELGHTRTRPFSVGEGPVPSHRPQADNPARRVRLWPCGPREGTGPSPTAKPDDIPTVTVPLQPPAGVCYSTDGRLVRTHGGREHDRPNLGTTARGHQAPGLARSDFVRPRADTTFGGGHRRKRRKEHGMSGVRVLAGTRKGAFIMTSD